MLDFSEGAGLTVRPPLLYRNDVHGSDSYCFDRGCRCLGEHRPARPFLRRSLRLRGNAAQAVGGVGMTFGLLNVVLVIAGVWYLPAGVPRIVQRLIQLVGMAGAIWSAGTLTRAVYALTV